MRKFGVWPRLRSTYTLITWCLPHKELHGVSGQDMEFQAKTQKYTYPNEQDTTALIAHLGLGLGLLTPGETGGDEKESRSTRLYLPERTLRASSLSSNATPTLDLQVVFAQDAGKRVCKLLKLWLGCFTTCHTMNGTLD